MICDHRFSGAPGGRHLNWMYWGSDLGSTIPTPSWAPDASLLILGLRSSFTAARDISTPLLEYYFGGRLEIRRRTGTESQALMPPYVLAELGNLPLADGAHLHGKEAEQLTTWSDHSFDTWRTLDRPGFWIAEYWSIINRREIIVSALARLYLISFNRI